jgi:hypothetical protein
MSACQHTGQMSWDWEFALWWCQDCLAFGTFAPEPEPYTKFMNQIQQNQEASR